MRILAIETSCDETAIAIAEFRNSRGRTRTRPRTNTDKDVRVEVLSHLISSQTKLHAKFGGVVPNLARREHEKNLMPMLMTALKNAKCKTKSANPQDKIENIREILVRESELFKRFEASVIPLAPPDIDTIAVTYGPGLAPALWTGVNFARALATLWHKPLIPVNHMAGHLYSAFLQKSGVETLPITTYKLQSIKFPALALLVSGGHTELVLMRKHGTFQIIGETRDDAVGEAFDKVARMLGLKYPGGPELARLALAGNPNAYALPRPMLATKDYDFSFSGLKTAVLYLIRDLTSQAKLTAKQKANIAASFQTAAMEVLVKKTIRAAKEHKTKTLILGGGVAANNLLRTCMHDALQKESLDSLFLIPDSLLCGDNALMIAAAAYFCNQKSAPDKVRADANLRLEGQ